VGEIAHASVNYGEVLISGAIISCSKMTYS
jgi:hypothetical protein